MNSRKVAVLATSFLVLCFVALGMLANLTWQKWQHRGAPADPPSPGATTTPSPQPSGVAPVYHAPVSDDPPDPPAPPPRPKHTYKGSNPEPIFPVKLLSAKVGRSFDVYAQNLITCPITVSVDRIEVENAYSEPRFPLIFTVPGLQKVKVATIHPVAYNGAFSYKTSGPTWMPGKLDARHDPDALYDLPYEAGTSYRLVDMGPSDMLRYRFDLPEDTAVLCARAGKVVYTEQRYDAHGDGWDWLFRENKVVVLHPDGTLGFYTHLRPQGVAVSVGAQVSEGDVLGYSGDTGWCDQPCLDFYVEKALSGTKWMNFPCRFDVDGSGEGTTLKVGTSYRAPEE